LNMPCMTVVTVNKVQDIYNTPVYNTLGSDKQGKDEEDGLLHRMN